MAFVHLPIAAQYITVEEDFRKALEKLGDFLATVPECAEQVLFQEVGLWGIDRVHCDLLRVEYSLWKELSARQKQSEGGKKSKQHLKRGKTKAKPG